jgi:hypothetical protein
MDALRSAFSDASLGALVVCFGGVLMGILGYQAANRQVHLSRDLRRSVDRLAGSLAEASLEFEHANARRTTGATSGP